MPQHNHHHNATRKPSPSSFSPLLLHLLVMASLLSLFLLSLLLFSFPSSSSSSSSSLRGALKSRPRRGPWASKSQLTLVSQACNATRFPDVCLSSLANSSLPPNPATVDVIRSAVGVSLAGLSTAQSMAQEILDSSAGNVNRSNAARNCLEVLADSRRRAEAASGDALMRGGTKDARAWMSASLLFQYDCSNALKYANDTALTAKTMLFLDSLMELTSNALAMAFALDAFGNDTASWAPPRTERDGFWGWAGHVLVGPDRRGTPVGSLKADVTVCKEGGGCDYGTVQEAVNAAPENLAPGKRFVIKIKAGVYEEIVRVPTEKRNLVFLGDGMGKTVLSNSLTAGPGISTYNTATVAVLGDGFMASGLTIQNTAPPPTHQAVAFRCDSDLSLLENCEFLGNQDTLYAHSLRQYYRSCRFEGNVDFIFGNSAAVFEDCIILVRPRQLKPEKGETNAVTAHGRTDPAQSTGFVFWNCLINGTDEYMALFRSKPSVHKNYLGRPWKEYSRTVFINSTMEAIINSQGWLPWTGDFALKTLYYGEFGNTGPGSDTSQRVSWSSQIPAEHVNAYSIENFIQGDEWIPTSS